MFKMIYDCMERDVNVECENWCEMMIFMISLMKLR